MLDNWTRGCLIFFPCPTTSLSCSDKRLICGARWCVLARWLLLRTINHGCRQVRRVVGRGQPRPPHRHRGAVGGVGGHDGVRLPALLRRLRSGDPGLLQRLQLPQVGSTIYAFFLLRSIDALTIGAGTLSSPTSYRRRRRAAGRAKARRPSRWPSL